MRPINVHIDTTVRLYIEDEADLEDETTESSIQSEAISVMVASWSLNGEEAGPALAKIVFSDISIELIPANTPLLPPR